MAKFRAGKSGSAAVNSIQMAMPRWNTTLSGDELDVSNFESNGRRSYLIGLQGLAWGIGTLWQSDQNPLVDPPGLYMRDDGTNMKLNTNVTDNLFWTLPTWMCSNAAMTCDVHGVVTFDASGKAQADFTFSGTDLGSADTN
jgi:hypothetical protein